MNQIAHTVGRFVARLAGMLGRGHAAPPEPGASAVPPVLRIGYAGHLKIEPQAQMEDSVRKVLAQITAAALAREPRLVLQAVGQLAQGADTLVALEALAAGWELHAILPGSRPHVLQDLAAGHEQAQFSDLVQRATRVMELDAVAPDPAQGLQEADYEQCAEVLLTRIDCLIALDHGEAGSSPGGTVWIERRARTLGIPVIRLPIDRPGRLVLAGHDVGSACGEDFHIGPEGVWAQALSRLVSRLVDSGVARECPFRLGSFERRFLSQLDIEMNRDWWARRWQGSRPDGLHAAAGMRQHVDASIGVWATWADHRASAMAELVRGAFVFCALLGLVAVSCALTALVVRELGIAAKVVEAACFFIVLWFIARDRRLQWRDQWLFFRQLERRLNHSAWLLLVGRELKHELPAEIRAFHGSAAAAWMSEFARLVVRASGVPPLRLEAPYRAGVRDLVLHRLIRDQADYFRSEAASQSHADHATERWIWRTFQVALVVTVGYLLLKLGVGSALHRFHPAAYARWYGGGAEDVWHHVSTAVSVVGVAMPCIAAALASVRSHGDFAQLARRYAGVATSLEEAEQLLEQLCPAEDGSGAACSSRQLAATVHHVASLLDHEATSWSAILHTKEFEPS